MSLRVKRIDIVGLGVAQPPSFSSEVQSCLTHADVIMGSQRQLDLIPEVSESLPQRLLLPKFSELKSLLASPDLVGKRLVVLASGDPLFYGIGRWFKSQFTELFQAGRLAFHPSVSSIQAACHKLGLSLQDVDVLSLHGRPLDKIRSRLKANRTLAILTDQYSHPQALAKECADAGFTESVITVCERLGYPEERSQRFMLDELLDGEREFDPLHVTIIEVKGLGGKLPVFPGFADTLFETGAEPGKGMISKREVRLSILSYLEPNHSDIIWDIGAGCGGVAVELAYWNEQSKVYAIEHHSERLIHLNTNRKKFGVVSNMEIIEGRAPECLNTLPKPTKIFIGGSDGTLLELLTLCWELLPAGGILVASAVMQTTKDQLKAFAESSLSTAIIESTEIAVKRGHLVDSRLSYQTKYPVEIFQFKKCVVSNDRSSAERVMKA
jgi:precorrin-6Y C5,15-methyltransferase (decarboxylating)